MIQVSIGCSEALRVHFHDSDGHPEDGEFEIHYNTKEHPSSIIVRETAGLPGSVAGLGNEILYQETFDAAPVTKMDDPATCVHTPDERIAQFNKQFPQFDTGTWVRIPNQTHIVKMVDDRDFIDINFDTGQVIWFRFDEDSATTMTTARL